MKNTILIIILAFIFCPLNGLCDEWIWSRGHHEQLSKVDSKGIIYDRAYGSKFGSVRNGVIYNAPYGGLPVGRIAPDGKIWNHEVGGKPIGRYENGKVYDRSDRGGNIVGETKDKRGSGWFILTGILK